MSAVEGYPTDPKVSKARVLRPYHDFEDQYEGQPAITPVSFYEVSENGGVDGVLVQDELAARPGYHADLERFVPTPFGSRVTVWLPYCVWYDPDQEMLVTQSYIYSFHWRLRNVPETAIARKKGFHSSRLDGYPDTRGTPHFAMPVTTNTILVEQPEALLALQQQSNLRRERIQLLSSPVDTAHLSILPSGQPGIRQQGMLDLADGMPAAVWASDLFLRVNFDAAGDELLIQARRADAFSEEEKDPWAFATTDAPFSYIYGRNEGGAGHVPPDGVGIYLFTGDAP